MKRILLASAIALGTMTTVALAETAALTDTQMDEVRAGKLTTTQTNGGGNTPKGNANGVPTVTTNSGGNQPPGHNK
jgi:hypothetical protein